jgi:succinyl-diaminopimelate desuccinylase
MKHERTSSYLEGIVFMGKNLEKYINHDKVIKLLSTLIEIHSPYFHEENVMEYVHEWLKEKNLPGEYHVYHELKVTGYKGKNVVGKIKGTAQGPRILLNGHLDTVDICEGWTKNPLNAFVEGDKLYGLGSLDMKSGVAAIMLAIHAFKETVKEFKGEVLYTFVSDEEGPFGLGTDALILDGFVDEIDVAIVPEPSSGFIGTGFPCLCLGARGGWNYKVEFTGKSSHAAYPEKGINAISDASKVLLELDKLEMNEDEKLGKGSICVIKMEGGGAACSVADKASFTIFRHVVRGEDRTYLEKEIAEVLQRANIKGTANMKFRDAPHHENGGFEPYIVPEDHAYTQLMQNSIKTIMGDVGQIRYFSSMGDFNYLATRAKIPTFVFGPDGENYHAPDEYVLISTVVKTAEIIYDFLVNVLEAK